VQVPRKVLVLATEKVSAAEIAPAVRARAGSDAEIHVVAPASKVSFLQWLANDEDAARSDAAERAEQIADAVPTDDVHSEVGDTDPIQAVSDALRTFPADELMIVTAPDEDSALLEQDLERLAQERFSLPVTQLTVGT
jgi:hypothetical protein